MHDKDATTSDRVEWADTLNLHTDNPKHALHSMIDTAKNADELKKSQGLKTGGQKVKNPVYTYSLSWEKSENPSKQEMMETAISSLKSLNLSNRQAIVIAHNDEAYKHIHIMVNRVDPVTGLIEGKKTISNDRLKLSKWAQKYEEEKGKIHCLDRVKNNERREQQFVKYKDDGTHRKAKHEALKGTKDTLKDKEFWRLVEHKRRAIKTRIEANKNTDGFKKKWTGFYKEVREDQVNQRHEHRKNVQKVKDVLANKYGIYKKNIYDQHGLVSRPFNYKAGQTLNKNKEGKIFINLRPSKDLRDKKEAILKAQKEKNKIIIEQVNNEFTPRFERLKRAQKDKTLDVRTPFDANKGESQKSNLKDTYKTATGSHQTHTHSHTKQTANDNSQDQKTSQPRPRTKERNRAERTRGKERTRTRERTRTME
ncbi:MAG: relaxase/mobilization nuclease domain-containing protein [Bacteroidetes bacterium]|nr:relaxase/mobilization nuclease domain-containing protein [Bacteroidota bacterium]